jgi:acetyl esterase/lipase
VAVPLHGCCGAKEDLAQLAWGVAARGAVVFNASWLATVRGGGYPLVYQQAACAVRFARATASRYGGDPRRVTLLGWSDGALLAAVIANAGDDFSGDCQVAGVSALPDALVAVSGFLGWEVRAGRPVMRRYVTPQTTRFFGGTPATAARAWAVGNPYTHLGGNHRLAVRLLVSAADPVLDDNQRFLAALGRAGQPASLRVVDGDPLLLISPRTEQGQVTVAETLQVARASGVSR